MGDNEGTSSSEKLLFYTLNIIGWFWNVFTFYPWYIISGNFKRKRVGILQSKSITGRPEGPYRSLDAVGGLISDWKGLKTLDQIFKAAIEKHGSKKALGVRALIAEEDEVQPNGRIFKKAIYGDYEWLSYDQIYDFVKRISCGLNALEIGACRNVILFAETKVEWMLCAQACFMRNFPVVTIYATLGDDAIVYGFNEVEASVAFVDAALLPKIKNLIAQLHYVKILIYFGEAKKSLLESFPENVTLYSLQDVKEKLGAKLRNFQVPIEPPKPEDTAVIMYTSGSTGLPKGVILSHRNVVSFLSASMKQIDFLPTDRYIAYLPLAHIMELVCEMACMANGIPIGYSSSLTLSDMSSKIKKGSKGDVSVLKPTLMAAVPMILDRMRKAVLDKIKASPKHTQLLFRFAYEYKKKQIRQGYDTPILNKLIFSKVTSILGGETRRLLSGGAPLSSQTQEFMNICFCCPVLQGFGLTETSAGCTLTEEWDQRPGRVGRPLPCLEVKLESWEEGGYTANDKPNPRGEIVISGNNVTCGYLNQPDKTKEVYIKDSEGKTWFYTGDIGEVFPDGTFRIIDRKKDLVKLSHGEYVSLGKLEAILKRSNYVETCCAYGDGKESYMVLLVVPSQQSLNELAKELSIEESFEELCSNKVIVDAVLKDVQKVSKQSGFNKSETPQKLQLCVEQWTPESEMVTAAFKLKRKNIQAFYQKDINAMYNQ